MVSASVPRNQADAMAAWTPFAGQLILPQVGHAGECLLSSELYSLLVLTIRALLQDHKFFNFAVEYFLDQEFDEQLPYY